MRALFFEHLRKQMQTDKRLFVLAADMGLGLVEPFQKDFPERYINVGIAEQNMAGVAAGLCNAGFRPFCYTICNFLVERCFEQLRNDICYHNYPVTLVGTSTGYDNGSLGPTHHVIDDIGCVKILPNIRIYSPGTVTAMREAFQDILKEETPAYLRVGKGSYDLPAEGGGVNRMVRVSEESDVLIITHGTIIQSIMKALGEPPIASVYCMTKIKPLDKETLAPLLRKYPKIVVIEDHFGGSGLFNSLCQYAVESRITGGRLLSLASLDRYADRIGDKDYFADLYGLTPEKVRARILDLAARG
jgi:transketolase